jgi:hypothetical protein
MCAQRQPRYFARFYPAIAAVLLLLLIGLAFGIHTLSKAIHSGYPGSEKPGLGYRADNASPVFFNQSRPKDFTVASFGRTLRRKLTPGEALLVTNPLSGTAEIDAWGTEIVNGATNDLQKASMLYDALVRCARQHQ